MTDREHHQPREVLVGLDDAIGSIGMQGGSGEDGRDPVGIPAHAVEEDAGNARRLCRDGIRYAVANVPDVLPGPFPEILQRLLHRGRRRLQVPGIRTGDRALEIGVPGPTLDGLELLFEKLPGAVCQDSEPDPQLIQLGQEPPDSGPEGPDVAIVIAIALVIGRVGDVLGVLVLTEEDLQQIRPGRLPVGDYLGMQPPVCAYVRHQLPVVIRLALSPGGQAVTEPEPIHLPQHIVHGPVHGNAGIHQGTVPIEEDDPRGGKILHDSSARKPQCGLRSFSCGCG